MSDSKANLQHLLEIAKRLDARDAEALGKAIVEIEKSRQQAKDLNQYGKWYAWLREKIQIKVGWTDTKHSYLSITEKGAPFVLGDMDKHQGKAPDAVDEWIKEAMKAERKEKKNVGK